MASLGTNGHATKGILLITEIMVVHDDAIDDNRR